MSSLIQKKENIIGEITMSGKHEELMKFKKWADEYGHYNVVEAVDRYFMYLDSIKDEGDE